MSSVNSQIVSKEIDSFCETMKSLGRGAFLGEAVENLKKAMESVVLEGKSASITLKITIKAAEMEGTINLVGSNSVTLPKPQIKGSFYIGEGYLPTRNQPQQIILKRN
ncbi:hypothetical protein NCR96_04250 [Helicobacter sp. 14348-15]|uniref:hypothetical protein n=1 Tax=Helicobacter colisuis TaxID=2949739 RepID=UPI00202B8991|nr:hypothetical protein [Helicobacter colisuis]MCL9820955.1 hypothetical protein [Helicobacter colisuis]